MTLKFKDILALENEMTFQVYHPGITSQLNVFILLGQLPYLSTLNCT